MTKYPPGRSELLKDMEDVNPFTPKREGTGTSRIFLVFETLQSLSVGQTFSAVGHRPHLCMFYRGNSCIQDIGPRRTVELEGK